MAEKTKKSKIQKKEQRVFNIVAGTLLTLYTLTLLLPLFWALMNSLKSRLDFYFNPLGFPEKYIFKNYLDAFKGLNIPVQSGSGTRKVYLLEMFFNSVVYSVGMGLTEQFANACCAYICAKFSKKYKFPRVIYTIVILKMLIPIVGNLGAMRLLYRNLGLYDNVFGIWLTSISFGGTGFLVYYAAFKVISWEYAEAAFMDGANHFAVLFRIMFPQAVGTFIALSLLGVIERWNDYSAVMIFLPSMPTVAYGLFRYQFTSSNAASSIPVQLAGCTLIILPMLTLFILFNKKIMGNVAIGGLKG